MKIFIFLIIVILIELAYFDQKINPYEILNVSKNADKQTIHDAYKKLAKEWHPDRNKSPSAQEKFVQIISAYEILSNSQNGAIQDENFNKEESEITLRIFKENLFPKCHIQPFIIFFKPENCIYDIECRKIEETWLKFKEEITEFGFKTGFSENRRRLAKSLEIDTSPSVLGFINGERHTFKGEFTLENLHEFAFDLIPSNLVYELNAYNYNRVIYNAHEEGRVLAVLVTRLNTKLSLNFQMPCLQMINNIKCATIRSEMLNEIDFLKEKIQVDTLLIFKGKKVKIVNEIDFNEPSPNLSYLDILQAFEANKFLNLPKLFNKQIFLDLCTSWTESDLNAPNKVVCVIFATDKLFRTPSFLFDSVLKTEFIQKISEDYRLKEKVKFATIDLNLQSKFIDNIIINSNINLVGNRFSKKVIVLKRLDNEFVHFDVHDIQIQTSKQDLNRLIESLKNSINLILTESAKFSFKMNIPDFNEEISMTSKFEKVSNFFESIIIIFISIIIIIILMLSLVLLLDSLNK